MSWEVQVSSYFVALKFHSLVAKVNFIRHWNGNCLINQEGKKLGGRCQRNEHSTAWDYVIFVILQPNKLEKWKMSLVFVVQENIRLVLLKPTTSNQDGRREKLDLFAYIMWTDLNWNVKLKSLRWNSNIVYY